MKTIPSCLQVAPKTRNKSAVTLVTRLVKMCHQCVKTTPPSGDTIQAAKTPVGCGHNGPLSPYRGVSSAPPQFNVRLQCVRINEVLLAAFSNCIFIPHAFYDFLYRAEDMRDMRSVHYDAHIYIR